jgi:hypothetical protein
LSGPLLHLGATVLCAHGGQAMPTSPNPRVLVSGQPVTVLSTVYTVAGCPLPPNSGGPCVTGQWVVGATRVLAGGQPVLLQSSQAVCTPTGTPLTVASAQTRVLGM